MRKIPTIFERDPENRKYVLPVPNPDCQWVFDGEGVATAQVDGTCVLLDDQGSWWARREVKPGKVPPPLWAEVEHDEATGKRVGWEPVEQSPFAKFHTEALTHTDETPPGTYELVGPKINGDPHRFHVHLLSRHGVILLDDDRYTFGRSYDSLRAAFTARPFGGLLRFGWEGIVWWRDLSDQHCDKAKIKVRDFLAADQ